MWLQVVMDGYWWLWGLFSAVTSRFGWLQVVMGWMRVVFYGYWWLWLVRVWYWVVTGVTIGYFDLLGLLRPTP